MKVYQLFFITLFTLLVAQPSWKNVVDNAIPEVSGARNYYHLNTSDAIVFSQLTHDAANKTILGWTIVLTKEPDTSNAMKNGIFAGVTFANHTLMGPADMVTLHYNKAADGTASFSVNDCWSSAAKRYEAMPDTYHAAQAAGKGSLTLAQQAVEFASFNQVSARSTVVGVFEKINESGYLSAWRWGWKKSYATLDVYDDELVSKWGTETFDKAYIAGTWTYNDSMGFPIQHKVTPTPAVLSSQFLSIAFLLLASLFAL